MKTIVLEKLSVWVVWAMLPVTVLAGDWPQFLGPARDGKSPETALVPRLPSELKPDWSEAVGFGYAGPVVADGDLLLFTQQNGQEILERRSVEKFALRWRVAYRCDYDGGMFRELGPRATPAVAEGAAVSLGSDGVLQAVDYKTGVVKWRKRLHDEFAVPESFFGVSGSPAVENGLIYINVGAKAAGCAAFRSTDGTVAWKATSDGASYASPVVADVAGKRAALFLARSGLHALDAKSGASLFFHPFRARIDASVNAATPILAEGGAFVSASYNTGAQWLNLADGKPRVRWKADDALACHYNTAVYHDGFLYGIDGRQEAGARLQCVDAKTGAVRWTKAGFGCASLIYADGKLLALRENGVLTMFEANPTEFRPQGEAKILTGTVRAHPALAGGRLYARDDKTLVSVNLDRR